MATILLMTSRELAMQQKAYRGIGMEGPIARWYTSTVRKHMEDYVDLAERISNALPENSRVLEVAPGPGYFSIELARRGNFRITGLDISETFVTIASENAMRAGVAIDFQQGDAAQMPLKDSSFDFILCRAAFKNFSDPVGALREMRRVLDGDGRALVIDMRRDASMGDIDTFISQHHHGFDAIVNRIIFRFLVRRAYSEQEFREFIRASGFTNFAINRGFSGFEITLTKGRNASP
jgi:ubiquinone/menaquinone biosynthesis C-methylase UbiE